MDHRIVGTVMPVLEMKLDPGESVVAEAGELSWMSASIELSTSAKTAGTKSVFGVVKRALGGGSVFMTEYTANAAPGMVAFATKVPGSILPIRLDGTGGSYMVHRSGYVCGIPTVELTIGFQRSLGAGLFGGEGFVLQKVSGTGDAWIELDGEVITYDLTPGETLRVHPGHVGMFEDRVAFDITRIKGIKNVVFGADGLFLAQLTGPGKVWLQSLPLPNLAHALAPYMPTESSDGGGAGARGGKLLGGILGGND